MALNFLASIMKTSGIENSTMVFEEVKSWIWVLNAIDKCRETAYKSKNKQFQDYWHGVADALEKKYLDEIKVSTYD